MAKEHSAVFQFDIKWVLLPNSSYKHEKNSCEPSGGADGLGGFPTRAVGESYGVYIFSAVQSGQGLWLSPGRANLHPVTALLCELVQGCITPWNLRAPPPPIKWGQKAASTL